MNSAANADRQALAVSKRASLHSVGRNTNVRSSCSFLPRGQSRQLNCPLPSLALKATEAFLCIPSLQFSNFNDNMVHGNQVAPGGVQGTQSAETETSTDQNSHNSETSQPTNITLLSTRLRRPQIYRVRRPERAMGTTPGDWTYEKDAIPRVRSCTDPSWVVIFVLLWCLLATLITDVSNRGDPYRFINGYVPIHACVTVSCAAISS